MLVRAIAVGYGGKDKHILRNPGDEFEVPDGEKADWYQEIKVPAKGKPKSDDTDIA